MTNYINQLKETINRLKTERANARDYKLAKFDAEIEMIEAELKLAISDAKGENTMKKILLTTILAISTLAGAIKPQDKLEGANASYVCNTVANKLMEGQSTQLYASGFTYPSTPKAARSVIDEAAKTLKWSNKQDWIETEDETGKYKMFKSAPSFSNGLKNLVFFSTNEYGVCMIFQNKGEAQKFFNLVLK